MENHRARPTSPPHSSHSPRPVLSPSNLNHYGDHPTNGGDARPESPMGAPSPAARPSSALMGRSPRDRMKIDTLLGSPRSPWSPRSLIGRAGVGPQRFTNRFEGRKARKTNLTNSVHRPSPSSPGPGEDSVPGTGLLLYGQAAAGISSSSGTACKQASFAPLHQAAGSSSPVARGAVNAAASADDACSTPVARPPSMSEKDRTEALLLLNCSVPFLPSNIKEEVENEDGSGLSYTPVQLFVAAVGEGKVAEGTPAKMRELLEQVVTKVSKEQNTVVHLLDEGPFHIQLRVFAANAIEAKALREYVSANLEQSPAPFVVLARHLPMAVTYEPGSLDPSNASVADRLRKQAKTRAIKLLREVIIDPASGITSAILRGLEGPMRPAQSLDKLINGRVTVTDNHTSGRGFIFFPAIIRRAADPANPVSAAAASAVAAHREDPAPHVAVHAPSTRPAMLSSSWQPASGGSPRHFPVSLMVVVIGDGELAPNTQPKLLHRLQQISTKVPKEHHLSVDLPQEGSLTIKLRLFVVNSEDAKATREYIQAHPTQKPAPIVVLSHSLPIAVSYDTRALDVSGANAVDCLRKQAKTRAVKLIKELISSQSIGMKTKQLRGYEGATVPADMLETPLMSRAIVFEEGKRFITFAARNRPETGGGRVAAKGRPSFPGLDSLADAAAMNLDDMSGQSRKRGKAEAARSEVARGPMLSQQRICELCESGNDGSYGTGRFCSKSCRYDAHALAVAQKRKGSGASKVEVNTEVKSEDDSE